MTRKKDQILSAAYRLLAEGNYQSMTTSKIAGAAGVAEGTLYRYFKSKRHLVLGVMGYYSNILMEKLFTQVDKTKSVEENLHRFTQVFYHTLKEDSAFYRILLKVFSELDSRELVTVIKDYYTRYLDRIKEVFIWAKDNAEITLSEKEIDLLVKTLWGMGEGIIKRSILYENHPVPQQEIDYSLKLIKTALNGGIL